MSNLTLRLLSVAPLLPLLILAIEWHNPVGVWWIVLAATALALREWMAIALPGARPHERWFGIAWGCALAGTFYSHSAALPFALAAATLATFLFFLFSIGEMATVAGRVSGALAGYLYIGLLLPFVALTQRDWGGGWVYLMLTATWFSDTGAYFAGRFLSPYWPRKFYESVSPKKTVVGAFGGLLATYGALVLAKLWYLPSLSWSDTVLIAVPANVLGQLGDLCESLIKRSVAVKDSGALLPGHGGMLDRIDALLFVAPYIYCYARWVASSG